MTSPTVSRRTVLAGAAGTAVATTVPMGAAASAFAALAASVVRKLDNTDTAITYSPAANWQAFSGLSQATHHQGTARSSVTASSYFQYTNVNCTQLRWFATRSSDRGKADVYLDGTRVATVDLYAASLTPSAAVWDSGALTAGSHTVKVVVLGTRTSPSTNNWVECDAIEVAEVSDTTFDVDSSGPIGYSKASTGLKVWNHSTEVPGRFNGSAHSTVTAGAVARYTHSNCSRIQWLATTAPKRGMADVYVDNVFKQTVDLYSATETHNVVIYDTGVLPAGVHTLKIVVNGNARPGVTEKNVEIDRLRVTGDANALTRVNNDHELITYFGTTWLQVTGNGGFLDGDATYTGRQGAMAEFSFRGSTIEWVGNRQPNHGRANVYIDNVLDSVVDTYSPTVLTQQTLFSKTGLSTDRFHTIRIEVLHTKNNNSSDYNVNIDAFRCQQATNAVSEITELARAELVIIKAGTKPYVQPGAWVPKPYPAREPVSGVSMLNDPTGVAGPFKTGLERNIAYLNYCWTKPSWVDSISDFWVRELSASNEGRMLMGAGHTLRWGERADMRAIVDGIVTMNVDRQRADGYVMPWAESSMSGPHTSERQNYDRAHWTHGMIAAILSGNTAARTVLRRFYDWFDTSPYLPPLVSHFLGLQGHIGGTLAYHSPVGAQQDMVAAERYYVQDWWLTQLKNREPLSISDYPFNRPHSYAIVALESYLDHYRATGAQKYLDAVLGGWDIFMRDYAYPGGGTAITEYRARYAAGTFVLDGSTNEACGAYFWMRLNHRLHQLYPNDERYVTEIERNIWNVTLAQQNDIAPHRLRYHAKLQGSKESSTANNTCCEVNGCGTLATLPAFLYTISNDGGLFVNMWESSAITWRNAGQNVALTTTTRWPYDRAVSQRITTATPRAMNLRFRVPSWAQGNMAISVNGAVAATGAPGTYVSINRTWANNDTITYTLPAGWRTTKLRGVEQVNGFDRYALEYGPILYALTGSHDATYTQPDGQGVPRITRAPSALPGSLVPVAGQPLQYTTPGAPGKTYKPYYAVPEAEWFNCFPVVSA